MGKLEFNKKKKKDALFNTAYELFTTKGFNKTTISDIVEKAGVAKGTFYLYFTDKLDVRNKLVADKAARLFLDAYQHLQKSEVKVFEDQVIFIADYIINQFCENKSLLHFIAKNLSWGIFRNAIGTNIGDSDYNIYEIYSEMVRQSPQNYGDPELMLFTVVELIGGTCHSCILYEQPVGIEEYKPVLYRGIRSIMEDFAGGS